MVSTVGTLGKTYVVKKEDRFYYKDASVLCFKNFVNINPYYLRYVMLSSMINEQIKENAAGAVVETLTITRTIKYFLPLPPIEEQKRIADLIDKTIEIIE